jgi:hypothetical protein
MLTMNISMLHPEEPYARTIQKSHLKRQINVLIKPPSFLQEFTERRVLK